jgi:hypothetical protein
MKIKAKSEIDVCGYREVEVIGKPIKYKGLTFYATKNFGCTGIIMTEPISGRSICCRPFKKYAVQTLKRIINREGVSKVKALIKEYSNGKNLNPELV